MNRIEAVSYFLSSDPDISQAQRQEFVVAVDDLISKIEKAQGKDGYLDIYFTIVDPEGRFRNMRDMHEMCECSHASAVALLMISDNCGHLLEGALAHYHWTGSRRFLDCMIRYVDLFIHTFGPNAGQLHGYPGHPELELAILRLYDVTGDRRHLDFAHYLLEARGARTVDMDDQSYFVWEAQERRDNDNVVPPTMDKLTDLW